MIINEPLICTHNTRIPNQDNHQEGCENVINSALIVLKSDVALKKEKVMNKSMDKKLIIYVASHIRFIDFWKKLRDSGVTISSTWIDHVTERGDKKAISRLWLNCFEEIRQSDMIMVKAEKEDRLKGVLAEIGAALVLDKPVYLVGENNNMGDIHNHPLFYRVSSPEEAIVHFIERNNSIRDETTII